MRSIRAESTPVVTCGSTPRAGAGKPAVPVEGADVKPEPGFRPLDRDPLTPGPLDADILWMYDPVTAAGTWPHDSPHASILVHGEHLYLNTSTSSVNQSIANNKVFKREGF